MSSSQRFTLAELVDFYNSEQVQSNQSKKAQTLPLILTHEQIKSALKNQSQIIKKIFTYESVSVLISYLQSENKSHAELLTTIKYDPSGQAIPLCLKLPFMAMEILSCECQTINELLFLGSSTDSPPLLPELLSFLDQPQHYQLASYFSRVICAITKRVSSASHKFNPFFSDWIFGNQSGQLEIKNSSLYKSINHLYSLTTIQYITKWLLISSKVKVKEEVDGQIVEKGVVQFRRTFKHQFLIHLIQQVSNGTLEAEVLNNIPSLFEQMLSQTQKSNKIATSLMIKSFPTIPSGPKITLYDLVIHEDIVTETFKSPEKNVNLAKIKLIKIYLNRYMTQLDLLQKVSEQEGEKELKMLQVLNNDHLTHVVEWMFQQLKKILNISKANNQNETSPIVEKEEIEQSRIRVTSGEKMIILHLLEVLRLIHSLESYRSQLVQFYNLNSSDLVRLIKRLMSLENNLIQLQTSKLVLSILKTNDKLKDRMGLPCEFARKLLTIAITQLIEVGTAQCHVIQWADIILSLETKHIFQNYEEEFEWDHIREIVEEAKKIHIGEYRLIQSNIDCFYSEEKALLKYSNFINEFKVEIVYEQKKEAKQFGLSEKKVSSSAKKAFQEAQNFEQEIQLPVVMITIEPENEVQSNQPQVNIYRDNYLQYDVSNLIEEL